VASLDEAGALGYQLAHIGYSKIDAGFFKRRFFKRKRNRLSRLPSAPCNLAGVAT
jgi:hypothetical protein